MGRHPLSIIISAPTRKRHHNLHGVGRRVQVLGRLRGGGEVTLFGQQHSISDAGDLDLAGKNLGPAKLKEVALVFSWPESATILRR